ncbi:choline/ethanolamine transporter FLVCR1-like isoform X2 [Periplaneta americana]|uniref:choline/ethanolamine transporter FLVCR1-like isoform X2 n=1 Tax=Periplaneta americana TaxID=6978 RepID=UPI0037E7E98A
MDADKKCHKPSGAPLEHRVFTKRWLILCIYFFFAVMSAFQWYQYSSIANVIERYYNVSNVAVDWTTGLRWHIIVGTFTMALGATVKVFSVEPHLFWVTFVGQTLVSLSQAVVLPLPQYVAAIWFGANQVSTACAIAVNGTMLGIALGLLLPPMIVHNHDNLEMVGAGLEYMFYWTAGLSALSFVFALIFLEAEPPLPPSHEQALKRNESYQDFTVLKNLILNPCYVLILASYAINQGTVNSLSTLLNRAILHYFQHGEEFAGRVGLLLIVTGMVGTALWGVIMDHTLKYRECATIVFALSVLGMVAFALTLEVEEEIYVYLSTAFIGFFLGSYVSIAYSFSYEVTYPAPEGTVGGMLSVADQVTSMVLTHSCGAIVTHVDVLWANNVFSLILVVGMVLHVFMKPELRRQAAHDSGTSEPKP